MGWLAAEPACVCCSCGNPLSSVAEPRWWSRSHGLGAWLRCAALRQAASRRRMSLRPIGVAVARSSAGEINAKSTSSFVGARRARQIGKNQFGACFLAGDPVWSRQGQQQHARPAPHYSACRSPCMQTRSRGARVHCPVLPCPALPCARSPHVQTSPSTLEPQLRGRLE